MSSESNTTERLIDLMYGEASEASQEEFLEEIAGSPSLQREEAELRSLMGDISEIWPDRPVSVALHQSIMDAAQSATLERAEKRQYVPPVKAPGLWSRLRSSGQFGQFAMVATVLIAGAFVFKFVNLDESGAINEAEVFSPSLDSAAEIPEAKPPTFGSPIEADAKKQNQLADKKIEQDNIKASNNPKKAEQNVGQAPAEKEKQRKSRYKKKRKERKPKALPAKTSRAKGVSKPAPGTLKNKAYFDDLVESDGNEIGTTDKRDFKIGGSSYEQRVQKAEELTLVPSKTIDSVSSKYSARDYRGTIQAADAFVGSKSGTQNERARALQLKAQSLANLGRYQEALRVYDSILKNYKTFQSSAISSARAEISRKLEERSEKKARKTRKKKSVAPSYDENKK